jgi:hypothetical protein
MKKASLADIENLMFKMPTDEEHREASLGWLSRVQPTLIDQWPSDLAALSIPTKMVRLDVPAVWDGLCRVQDGEGLTQPLYNLADELDREIGWERKFIRLNSRSPKDAPWPFEIPATISGKEAVHILLGSMRVMDDLMEFKWIPEQPAYVCLRDFMPGLRSNDEYRCFVKDGELIAVTHYDYTQPWIGPEDKGKELRNRIDKWFTESLRPVLHIDTVVFDLWVKWDGSFVLIEINPYGLSDPCYFGSYEAVESADCWIKYAEADGD